MSNSLSKKTDTLKMVQTALLAAVIIVMGLVPFLGFIPLGFMNATIIHIPVIIGSILLGPKVGACLGGVFGLTSFLNATFRPNATSFVFSPFYSLGEFHGTWASLIVAFVPRILIGVVPYFVYVGLMKLIENKKAGKTVSLSVAGIAGSLTNTILVMGFILLFFREPYAQVVGESAETVYLFILSIICMSGVPEAIVASIITTIICTVLMKSKVIKNQVN